MPSCCNRDNHRFQRDISYHDTVMISLGPMLSMQCEERASLLPGEDPKDPGSPSPLTSQSNTKMKMNQRLHVEVRTEAVDEWEIATIMDFCWATPVDMPATQSTIISL